MIQAVIWDIGGVLLRTHSWHGRWLWDDRLGLPQGSVEELVFNSELGTAAQLGRMSVNEHWRAIGRKLALHEEDLVQLRRDFWAGDEFDYNLLGFIRSLRPKYQTAVISNAFDDLRHVLLHEIKAGDAFDHITVSAEEGVMKPHPDIYRRTLTHLQCPPIHALFIDDSPRNIAGAQALGMQTILYERGMDIVGAVGVVIGN